MVCTTVTEQCQNECILGSLMFTWLRPSGHRTSFGRLADVQTTSVRPFVEPDVQ